MDNIIKLSVITINLNNKTGLEKTIKSVLNQTYSDFEYIIIDGASKDGSTDIIAESSESLSYWVSEPDNGLYDAMNKGIRKAEGEYCLFLNSGDIFLDSAILEKCFSYNFFEDIVYCNLIFDSGSCQTRKIFPDELTFNYFFLDSIGHPSSFIKKELFYQVGLFNDKLKIVSDWEFFIKAIFIKKCTVLHVNEYLAVFDRSGLSNNSGELMANERSLVLEELFPRFIQDYQKLNQITAYTTIHSGNKKFRRIASLVNKALAAYRYQKKATKNQDKL